MKSAAVAAAALAGLAAAVWLQRARRRRHQNCRRRLVLYDRLSSNNSARLRIWLRLRGFCPAEASDGDPVVTAFAGGTAIEVELRRTTHEQQRTAEYKALTPFAKVPALLIVQENDCQPQLVAESAVIARYLEETWQACSGGQHSLLPSTPEGRAHMDLVLRTHDLYLASPNCTQPGAFTHTQGCFYVPPRLTSAGAAPQPRWIDRTERAAKLKECWEQLDVLEGLLRGPYFCGGQLTLADCAIHPTMTFFVFFAPRTFGWSEGAVWHERPRLHAWYYDSMLEGVPGVREVTEELDASVRAKEESGMLVPIRKDVAKDTEGLKWVYP